MVILCFFVACLQQLQGYAIIIEYFLGDVFLNSFNIAYRDEDRILDQIYRKQIFSDFHYKDLKSYKWSKKMHI